MVNVNKKDINISFIRCIAMFMIVLCHILQYMNNELAWWFNVGVQIFFIISGFLYGQRQIENWYDWIKKRLKKILSPYYIYIILISAVYFLFARDLFNFKQIIKNVLCVQHFIGGMIGLEHLWFISFIIICYFITPILQSVYENLLKDKSEILFWITFIFIIVSLQFISFIGIINVNIPNLSCYIIGYFISRRYCNLDYKKSTDKVKLSYLSVLFTLLSIINNGIVIYMRYIEKVEGMKSGNLFFDYSHMLLGLSLFFIIYLLIKNHDLKQSKLIDFSDKYSFEIYIVHQLYILGRFSLMNLTPIMPINILVILFMIVISSVILKYLTNIIIDWLKSGFRLISG